MISTNTLADNKTTSTATSYTLDCIQSTCTGIYNPYTIQYDPCNYTITASTSWPLMATLESDSNELKINIKKFQIKFNFNL